MKTLYIVVLLAIGLAACKNNSSDPAPGNTTNQNLLNTWKVSQVLEGALDITSEFSQYRLTFEESNGSKNFTLVKQDGTSFTGSWEISTDETTITLTTNGNVVTLSGVRISASELKYATDEDGKTGLVRLNFVLGPA